MRIAHFSGTDAPNYGDQLFPLVFDRRLAGRAEMVPVSAKGGGPLWPGCATSISVAEAFHRASEFDAVVIGGGHIIHARTSTLPFYDDGALGSNLAYPSLWAGAAELAASGGLPLCWNAPGVPSSFATAGAELVRFAVSVSDAIAVRDAASRDLLLDCGVTARVSSVVDTALDVSALWTREQIDSAYEEAFLSRSRSVPSRTVAIHVKSRYLTESLASHARRLDRIAASLQATPILLALGPCHGDAETQRQVAALMRSPALVVDEPSSLIELAACIARSCAYLGSSLHGMITACAFDVPGLLVASESTARFRKFTGFLDHVGAAERRCDSWRDADEQLRSADACCRKRWKPFAETQRQLDAYWQRLVQTLQTPLSAPRRAAKAAALEQIRDRFRTEVAPFGVAAGALLDHARLVAPLLREIDDLRMGIRQIEHVQPRLTVTGVTPVVDVVVCVHDAVADVERCLNALDRTTTVPFNLRIVNDGSSAAATEYLRAFAVTHPRCVLEENLMPVRYTAAANQGLQRSRGDYVVLLNSDTVVPHDWLARLIAEGERRAAIGLLGPLSNAAAWQSVPEVHDESGDWKVNEIPPALSVEAMAGLVAACAPSAAPAVPMLNGFCLVIKRTLLDRIGLFDIDSFPDGYGEEIDYCFRGLDAGFQAVVVDSAYVFHAKSRSYGHARRRELTHRGRGKLVQKFGAERLENARDLMRQNAHLAVTRSRVRSVLEAIAHSATHQQRC